MSLRYTREALRDLDEISAYIAEHNLKAAVAFLDAVETVAQRLERFPRSAMETEMAGVRRDTGPALPLSYFPHDR